MPLLTEDLQNPVVLSMAAFGLSLTLGYVYFRLQKQRHNNQDFHLEWHDPAKTKLEKDLESELQGIQNNPSAQRDADSDAPENQSNRAAEELQKQFYKRGKGDDDDPMKDYLPPHS